MMNPPANRRSGAAAPRWRDLSDPSPSAPAVIGVEKTVAWHARLARLAAEHGDALAAAHCAADRSLRKEDRSFGGLKELPVPLSALWVDERDVLVLRSAAEMLFGIVERAVDWLLASPDRLLALCPDQLRVAPYFAKTRGWDRWQIVSRYDAVVTADGRLRVIELNTGCPAGFMHAEAFSRATVRGLCQLSATAPGRWWPPRRPTGELPIVARGGNVLESAAESATGIGKAALATIDERSLVDGLLAVELAAEIEPGLVALLVDENRLTHELDLMVEAFRRRGREAAVVDAQTVRYRRGRLWAADRYVSLTYDKFRISVPTSGNHCWRAGFEARYADLLAAIQDQAVVAANNLVAQSVAEDKSLVALVAQPDVAAVLTDAQRQFVRDHVVWTARLVEGTVDWHDRRTDLLPLVRRHPELFVIKPCHEGRGYGVHIGRETPRDVWHKLCRPDPATPRVVQEFVEPLTLPVVCDAAGAATVRPMYVTLGLGVVCGRYQGVLSRVSPSLVTNVAREGMVQAVLQSDV